MMEDYKEIKVVFAGKEYVGYCTGFVVDFANGSFEITGKFNPALTDPKYVDPALRDKLCSVDVRL